VFDGAANKVPAIGAASRKGTAVARGLERTSVGIADAFIREPVSREG
jgi:hypothetical protein